MKTKSIIFLFFICLTAIIFFCVDLENEEIIHTVKFITQTENTNEEIYLFEDEEKYYAFLPSYTSLSDLILKYDKNYKIYLNDTYFESNSSCKDIEINKNYTLTIKNLFDRKIFEAPIIIMQSANIPALSVHIANGTINEINNNKNIERTGFLSLINNDSTINHIGTFKSLHGRGNSSWTQQKKPYTIEFENDVNLLDMGAAKKWILVANSMDESNIRNKIVYDTAIESGLEYSVDSRYVDLYIDGVYHGLYLLTEKVEVDETRINITNLGDITQNLNQYKLNSYDTFSVTDNGILKKAYLIPYNPEDLSGGYLLELQLQGRVKDDFNLFITKSNQPVTIKHPPYASKEQIDYISSLFQEMENSLLKDNFDDYIDVDSWVKFYLVQEVFCNISQTSFFFYKNSDTIDKKLYAGPIWDFDLSLGTGYESANIKPQGFYICTWGWFEKLYQNKAFNEALRKEYINNFRQLILDIIDSKIDIQSIEISNSYLMNEIRWQNIQNLWWVNRYDTQAEHVKYLKDFLTERINFLDKVWIYNESIESVLNEEIYEPSANNIEQPIQKDPENEINSIVSSILNTLRNHTTTILIMFLFAIISCVVFITIFLDLKQNFKVRKKMTKEKKNE